MAEDLTKTSQFDEHSFRYINLESNETGSLNELLLQDKLSVFIMYCGNVSVTGYDNCQGYNQLSTLLKKSGVSFWPYKEDNEQALNDKCYTAFIPKNQASLQSISVQTIHFTQKAGESALLITVGNVYSSTLANLTHGFIDWYLVWDDGNQWDKTFFEEKDAWIGSGWLSRSHRQSGVTGFPDMLSNRIDQNAWGLARRYLFKMDDSVPPREVIPQKEEIERCVLRIAGWLASYLPLTREREGEKWRPYTDLDLGNIGAWIGPRPWFGIYHAKMHMDLLERELILDGWLTLWEDKNDKTLYLQPASLALLYWAAKKLTLPASQDPVSFIKNHDWKGWFGGRWTPVSNVELERKRGEA